MARVIWRVERTELTEFVEARHGGILKTIAEKKALDDGVRKSIDDALREFRTVFQAEAA